MRCIWSCHTYSIVTSLGGTRTRSKTRGTDKREEDTRERRCMGIGDVHAGKFVLDSVSVYFDFLLLRARVPCANCIRSMPSCKRGKAKRHRSDRLSDLDIQKRKGAFTYQPGGLIGTCF